MYTRRLFAVAVVAVAACNEAQHVGRLPDARPIEPDDAGPVDGPPIDMAPTVTDRDGDGIADSVDNCPDIANADQSNLDGDALGDVCDNDRDGDGALDAADNCPTVPNADQADANSNGKGDACDGLLAPQLASILPGLHLASAGAGFSGRQDGVVDAAVTIALAGIPANAHVLHSFLYWAVIGRAFAKVTLDDTAVTGAEIGRAGDTCWDIGQNFVYRADVTAQVRGNGNYRLSGLLSTTAVAAPDGQGASLVVLYVDPADPKPNYVAINDGAAGQIVFGATPVSTTMRGATIGAGFGNVTITNLVGDGQTGADALTIGTTVLGGGDAFHGADGAMWDNRIDDATAAITAGATSISQQLSETGDCLVWVMSAVSVEDVHGTPRRSAPSVIRRRIWAGQ